MDKDFSQLIFNSISDGVFTVDKSCVITSFNKAAERITGFTASEAIGRHCFDIFRTEVCHRQCALKDTLKTHAPVENARVTIITREGREMPINVTTTMLKNEAGELIGAVEFFRDISEIEYLRKSLDQKSTLDSIISVNPHMHHLINLLPDIAQSECNVLIHGPSGSGKELFAQVIHGLSPRRYGPYIKINCAALPANLLESELFGYEQGAFTDAKRNKPGQFSMANGGTLLLDEISEMDIALQVKLLRVLNNGEYRPLGSTKTFHTNARIIAATNADLGTAIADGKFREDLYYRINVVDIKIPPLRERPEDIPLLVNHFIELFRRKRRKSITKVSPEALAALRQHPLPGNVRELENAIEHAFVLCHGTEIRTEHLPPHIISRNLPANFTDHYKRNEKDIILETLQRYNGNKVKAAKELGIHRSTLWRKIKMLGLGT
ncbi:MAG: sigma 54-interacting transcriptional regulator [candidate division Zixibacteria bacterium]|nr:sigma 54-interacting transcriptional regulator [candidate division Zixibacteria bacterium]MDD5425779.1 sigma 54-interacting transcriptional regulator [candidate division Zixibacteria bacterium]